MINDKYRYKYYELESKKIMGCISKKEQRELDSITLLWDESIRKRKNKK